MAAVTGGKQHPKFQDIANKYLSAEHWHGTRYVVEVAQAV